MKWRLQTLLVAMLAGSAIAWAPAAAAEVGAPEDQAADNVSEGVSPAAMPATEPAPVAPSAKGKAPTGASPSRIVRMTRDYDLWIDPQRKRVIVDGAVCLREGQLEMFACPRGTKEHESIVAVNCNAQFIHAALIAVGAKPGQPVSFTPTYRAATGTPIEVYVLWIDKQGERHQVRAQEWVRDASTGKPMPYGWVFAGSNFFVDESTGQRYYQADGGDLICVSNFPSATLDLPIASTQENSNLLFAAFTERIPPLGTKVRLVLEPQLAK